MTSANGDLVDSVWLETVLDRHQRESSIQKILSVKREEAVPKGDNYGSDISRLVLECLLGDGTAVTRRLIVKAMHSSKFASNIVVQLAFKKESIILSEIVPRMLDLLKEAGEIGDPLSSDIIYFRPYDLIIMKDLSEEGFKIANRFQGLDLEEATVAMRELGRFHAVGAAMKEKCLIDPEDYRYDFVEKDTGMYEKYYEQICTVLSDIIDKTWGPEWKSYAENLRKLRGQVRQNWKKILLINDTDFNVLLHGDYQTANIMFKKMPNKKTPIGIRMIDFQMSYYGCFAFDILYLTNTSLSLDVRKNHYEDLLNTYYQSLSRVMEKLKLAAPPTLDILKEQIRNKSIAGLFNVCFMMPTMKANPEDALEFDDILKPIGEDEEVLINKALYQNKIAVEYLKFTLSEFRKLGIV